MSQAYFGGASPKNSRGEAVSDRISRMGKDAASRAGEKVSDGLHSLGGSARSAAETVREKSPRFASSAAEYLASAMETGGGYLEDHELEEMADDAVQAIKKHPVESILIGFGVGMLLGRAVGRWRKNA